MSMTTTYTDARARLAQLWNQLEADREMLVIERRGHESMVMIPIGELSSLLETAHLLRSPANARRLLEALGRAQRGEGAPATLEQLRAEFGSD